VELIPGKPCGQNCSFKVDIDAQIGGKQAAKLVITRPSQYSDPDVPGELREVEKLIGEQGDKVSLNYLEQRAQRKRANDYFYIRGDTATVGGLVTE
jgi:hypothetical protein